jgi:hypothetical protein
LPPFEDYGMKGRTYPLGANEDLTPTVEVKNTRTMSGDEVVELY